MSHARGAFGAGTARRVSNQSSAATVASAWDALVCVTTTYLGRATRRRRAAPSKFTVTSRNAFRRARSNAFHRHEFEFSKEARNREKARRGAAVSARAVGRRLARGQDNERRGAWGCGRAKRAPTWRYTRYTPMRSRTATTTCSSGWCSATARAPPPASTRTQGFTRGRRAGRARPRPTSPPRTARPPPPPRPPRASRRGPARPSSARPRLQRRGSVRRRVVLRRRPRRHPRSHRGSSAREDRRRRRRRRRDGDPARTPCRERPPRARRHARLHRRARARESPPRARAQSARLAFARVARERCRINASTRARAAARAAADRRKEALELELHWALQAEAEEKAAVAEAGGGDRSLI